MANKRNTLFGSAYKMEKIALKEATKHGFVGRGYGLLKAAKSKAGQKWNRARKDLDKAGNRGFLRAGQIGDTASRWHEGSKPYVDKGFYGHAKVVKKSVVKNPPKQISGLGSDKFYSDVKNVTGQK